MENKWKKIFDLLAERSRADEILEVVTEIELFDFVFMFVFAEFSIAQTSSEVSTDAFVILAISVGLDGFFGSVRHFSF